ncbi:permease-like cell division protein FtsX [Nonomuraea sp. NPDC050643]|uniref:permease-like cell division protein FtsX n=1 Tax=Nonomuraea sp. NPDC050643 TaxID=3155660 RepID=UPI0033C38D11
MTEVRFVDRASAYEGFRRDFARQKRVLKTPAKDVPESFRVRVEKGMTGRDRLRDAVVRRPGVFSVVDEAEVYGDPGSRRPDVTVVLCNEDDAMDMCASGRGAANHAMTTAKEKKAIVAAIEEMREVQEYTFTDQAAAHREFVENFESLAGIARPEDMPESYELTMRPSADWDAVIRRLARLKGVSQVADRRWAESWRILATEYGIGR